MERIPLMPRVTITQAITDSDKKRAWIAKQTAVIVNTDAIRNMLGEKRLPDFLILSIRDSIMIKCLRAGRNVILDGNYSDFESIERIAEVVEAQAQIDNQNYVWKLKKF